MGSLAEWKTAAQAGQPPEKAKLLKEYVADQIKSEGDGKYTFAISTGAIDRERDTVAVAGWDLDNYRKNPVVLWAHDYSGLPVGRSESILGRNGQLVARMEFVPGEVYQFADTVRQLVDGGYLKATSVGFRPLEWSYDEERGGFNFLKQELLEFSIVPVPANPEALIEARHAGISLVPLKDWAIRVLDTYQLSPEEKAEAARVLKIATGAPALVTVSGDPDGSHAAAQPGDKPGPENPSKDGSQARENAFSEAGREPATAGPVERAGRTLSARSESLITQARDSLNECLSQIAEPEDDDPKSATREPRLVVLAPSEPRKIPINPESVKQAVRDAVQAEVRRLRGRLD